jgi:hypothetical protein
MRTFGAWLASLACALVTGASLAGEGPRVILVADDAALARKVRAEAEEIGLRVVTLPSGEGGLEDDALLRVHDGVAIVRLRSGGRASLLVTAPDGTRRERPVDRDTADGDAYALRLVEELHGDLVALKLAEAPTEVSRPESPKSDAAERRTEPPPAEARNTSAPSIAPLTQAADRGPGPASTPGARLWLGGGLAGAVAEGGMGPGAQGAFSLAVEPFERWRLAADLLLPITENEWNDGPAVGEATVTLVLGKVAYAPLSGSFGAADAGLGAGLVALALQGEASPPLVTHSERLYAAVYFAHASGAWNIAPWMRLRTTLLAGASAPRPVARIAGEESATWGRPFAGAIVTAELGVALSGRTGG